MDYTASADTLFASLSRHRQILGALTEAVPFQGEDGVLLCLRRSDSPMLSGAIMAQTGLTTGRIANILKALERKGLIARTPDEEDRRRVHVALTGAGRDRAERLYERMLARLARTFSRLGETDTRELIRLTDRFLVCCSPEKDD